MKTGKIISLMLLTLAGMLFSSCATIPKGAVAVTPFNMTKYLGKWYEIARLDF